MKIIIAGAGAVGTHLAKLLSRDHQDCVLIDEEESRLEGLDTEFDIMTLLGSPTSIKTLKEAGIANTDLFVGVTPDVVGSVQASQDLQLICGYGKPLIDRLWTVNLRNMQTYIIEL